MSKQILSLALRPTTFANVVGQKTILTSIQQQLASDREPPAWMFVGNTGSGKTTLARILAISLNCVHQEAFGYPCDACVKNSKQFNIYEINASEVNGVEEIKETIRSYRFHPEPPSRRRVFILDEAQRLSTAAQNLLLKPFENCPETVTWIICTTDPDKILGTLRGRCTVHKLADLSYKGIARLVGMAADYLGVNPQDFNELVDELRDREVRSARLILNAIEKFSSGVPAKNCVQALSSEFEALPVCQALMNGDWPIVRKEVAFASPDDCRRLRYAAAGYMKGVLVQSPIGLKTDAASKAIRLLADTDRVSDGLQAACTISALHDICRLFGGGSSTNED